MAGKIWRYDSYDLRKFAPGEINYFIDIGANLGATSLMAKILNPTARVFAFEPSPDIYNILIGNMKQWMNTGIECHNVALGDGSELCLEPMGNHGSGMHRFHTEQDKQWWPEEHIMVPSKTLSSIFQDYNIPLTDTFLLKIDCEGGERFLLSDEQKQDSLEIIRKSVQTMFEIHIPFGGTGEQWNNWFKKVSDTHELRIKIKEGTKESGMYRYRYVLCEEFSFSRGKHEVELVNKNWVGPYPGRGK